MNPDHDKAAARSGPTRRTVLKGAAWSVPVIAVAAAAPIAAASQAIPACTFQPTAQFTTSGATLVADGQTGVLPQSNGQFGTGWTPPIASTQNPDGTWSQTDGAVDPVPAGWWQAGGDPMNNIGFMSLDDHDNRDGASQESAVVSGELSFSAVAGTTYTLSLPVYSSADYLGAQFLEISYAGAGNPVTPVLQGYYGDASISVIPAPYNDTATYPHFASAQQIVPVTVTASTTGIVTFTYTFTLMYVSGGQRQNADMWVQAPIFQNCE